MFFDEDVPVTPPNVIGQFFVYLYVSIGVSVSISILVWVQAGFVVTGTYLEDLDKLLEIIVSEVAEPPPL